MFLGRALIGIVTPDSILKWLNKPTIAHAQRSRFVCVLSRSDQLLVVTDIITK